MPRTAATTRTRRAGLTLAELSVSLAVIATLMVAIGSVMVLTGRAVGMTASQAEESRIDDLVATIASEQRMALTVTDRSSTSITFTVADRDHDGVNERIQYTWAGKDQPLMRKVNDQPAVVVLPRVEFFRLGYIPKTSIAAGPVPQTETTTDELLFAHESGSSFPHMMSTSASAAQSFIPKLARADATSWRVTQVQIMANRSTTSSTAKWTISLCPSDALGKPNTLAPIEQTTLFMSKLTATAAWSPVITFTTAQNLNPSERYWIVVSQSAVSATGNVSYDPSSSDTPDPFASTAVPGVWTTYSGRDMKIRVYGRYKYPSP